MTTIDTIAAAIHETWRALSRAQSWSMSSDLDCPYGNLPEQGKADNRAAARRMADVLAIGGLTLSGDLTAEAASIAPSLEPMAEAEHNGWMAHRAATGWTFGPVRDDAAKKHPSMIPYAELPETEKEKDRGNDRHYPDFAARAGLKIVRRI